MTTSRQNAALDAVAAGLRADACSFAAQVRALAQLADLAGLEELDSGVRQFPMMELAGTARLGAATATRRLAEADRIVTTLPVTLRLLERGELLVHQARVVLAETAHCDPEVARTAEAQVVPDAVGLCPADLRKALRSTVLRVESELDAARQDEQRRAEQRLADARAERRTWTTAEPDGMGIASALMTAEQLRRSQLDLDQLERAEHLADRDAGVERTSDQRRADLVAALPGMVLDARRTLARAKIDADAKTAAVMSGVAEQLGGGSSSAPPARTVLNVLVPVATILDLSREPAGLDGVGPISAEHVRLLRPTGFRCVLVDHDTGQPLHVDDRLVPADPDPVVARRQVLDMLRPTVVTDRAEPQHDPSAALARLVDLRDARCAGPGCSHTTCHRDHTAPGRPDPPPPGTSRSCPTGATRPSTPAGPWSTTPTAAPPGPALSAAPTTGHRPTPDPRTSTPTPSSQPCGHLRQQPRPGAPSRQRHRHQRSRRLPRNPTTRNRRSEPGGQPVLPGATNSSEERPAPEPLLTGSTSDQPCRR